MINIILDPIFIFGLKWGMMGAAVATVIGQIATALLAVWYLINMKLVKPAKTGARKKTEKETCRAIDRTINPPPPNSC